MKSLLPLVLVVLALVPQPSQAGHDTQLFKRHAFYANLDGEGMYDLYWSFDLVQETISFAVHVNTTGWVGFGISRNGQMPGSDVVIGWVNGSGNVIFHVRDYIIRMCIYF